MTNHSIRDISFILTAIVPPAESLNPAAEEQQERCLRCSIPGDRWHRYNIGVPGAISHFLKSLLPEYSTRKRIWWSLTKRQWKNMFNIVVGILREGWIFLVQDNVNASGHRTEARPLFFATCPFGNTTVAKANLLPRMAPHLAESQRV